MIYTTFQGLSLSRLGFGCMRFPVTENKEVDIPATKAMIDRAIAGGVNYFDTAWGYHSEQSELVVRECLAEYPRKSYYLATKFPGYAQANFHRVSEIFEKQLEKCGVDYFDFYLFHNVSDSNIENYLNPEYGVLDYLMKQKAEGKIRHLGFSTHASLKTMRRFLEAYGYAMEFCQIQFNWLDRTRQNAEDKVLMLKEYQIPVWVMEPLRGGMLATLSEEQEARLKVLRPDEGIPAWSFRYALSVPETAVILSGMSTMEQVEDNLATFREEKPLNTAEKETLFSIAEEMNRALSIPCTACRYCTDYCPQSLDIPALLSLYNENSVGSADAVSETILDAISQGHRPADCIACRSCEEVCPQQIRISEVMARFASKIR
ncbi:MAG: 4Fe-4S dicluster domain-containing protein [Ruminococcaceae bacterium]|nr:4Fe-4S dicluster domain-containing protein [Oscillospiraceae bacterium]